MQQQYIKAHPPKGKLEEILDDTRKVVWVSFGRPNCWNLLWSGMLQYICTAKAYIIFENDNMVRPNRFKRIFSYFGKNQMVIIGDVDLKNKIVEVKYKGVIYKTKEDMQELINTINNQ